MSTIPPNTGVLGQQGQQNPYGDVLREVDLGDFLDMMIAELQNQDPLNPMDNREILEQIGQIREIVANDRLTETLEAAFLGQNLATAGGMIGDWIVQLASDASVLAAGQVDRVSIEDGIPRLHVGNKALELKDLSQIQSETEGLKLAAAMSIIGRQIRAQTDPTPQQLSHEVTGTVDRVSLQHGAIKLHIGEYAIDPDNVLEIVSGTENPAGES